MRLLKKDEINSLKASEKRTEIDIGLKIARRVDGLREMNTIEEQNLSKFREQTTKIVQAEIDAIIKKKGTLEYEVGVLERHSKLLKKPFDEEWETIRKRRLLELDELYASIDQRQVDILEIELNVKDTQQRLEKNERRIKENLEMSKEKLEKAQLKAKEAQSIWNNAEIKQAQINSELDAKTNALNTRENELKVTQNDLTMREDAIKRAVKELADRERFITDKYNTMLRTQNFINNKNKK